MKDQLSPGPFPSWDDFRFFLATSSAGSFSKAASELGVTQPTISRRIENLEHRLGVRLSDPGLGSAPKRGIQKRGAACPGRRAKPPTA